MLLQLHYIHTKIKQDIIINFMMICVIKNNQMINSIKNNNDMKHAIILLASYGVEYLNSLFEQFNNDIYSYRWPNKN